MNFEAEIGEAEINQRIFRFDNGYEASVVCHDSSYGGPEGLFELAVMVNGEITYDTPVTGDVIGWLDEDKLARVLDQIAALPDREGKPAGRRPDPLWVQAFETKEAPKVETVTLTQVFTPVRVNTLPCPHCGDKVTVVIPQHQADQLFAPRAERLPMQEIFPEDTSVETIQSNGESLWLDCDADFRERFISGMCPACWAEIYGEED